MEDEETTKANWLSSSWELLDTSGHSGTHCWTDSPMGNSNSNTYSTLVLAGTLDLSTSTNPQLVFWHRGYLGYRYKGKVQISTDSGHTYTTIWQNSDWWDKPTWVQTQLDLTSFRSPRVRLRFVVDRNDYDGWYIDDVYIGEDTSTMVDWCSLATPASITTSAGIDTDRIYALVYEAAITDSA